MGRQRADRNTPSADLIEDFRLHLEAGGKTPRTIESATEVLYRLDRELEEGLASALREELIGWLARHRWSASTKATYRAHIVGFFGWATDEEDPRLTYNPAVRLPRPKVRPGVPRPSADDWVRRCVTEAAQPWRLHCILAAYAGLRPIEIAALDRRDITDKWLFVRSGKGNKPAVVPTEPQVWQAVRDLPPGPVTWQQTMPATAGWVSRSTARHLHAVMGIDTSLRYLRHWHGTSLRRRYDLKVVQERMRHENLNTTQVYTLLTEAELLASTGALPDFTAPAGAAPSPASQGAAV